MGGNKPKPHALRELTGSRHRSMNHSEPKVAGRLTVPRSLSPEARKHWKRLIAILGPLGLVTVLDRDAFVSLCETLAIVDRARLELRKSGLIVMIRGKVSTSPFWRLLRDAECQSNRMLVEFGMTPSARTRLYTNPVPPAPTMNQDIDAESYFGDSPAVQ